MKKAWLYLASAVALGLTLVLVPLALLTSIEPTEPYPSRMQSLEGGTASDSVRSPSREVSALAISFFVALATYALLKRKTPSRPSRHFSPYPF